LSVHSDRRYGPPTTKSAKLAERFRRVARRAHRDEAHNNGLLETYVDAARRWITPRARGDEFAPTE